MKIKKETKRYITGLITGLVIAGCIGIYAAVSAKDIAFTPTNAEWNVNNVEDAMIIYIIIMFHQT